MGVTPVVGGAPLNEAAPAVGNAPVVDVSPVVGIESGDSVGTDVAVGVVAAGVSKFRTSS
jgi:hypothetical protein